MKKALIVSGGFPPDKDILKGYKEKGYSYIIAADRGAAALIESGMNIDLMLGDFDSVDKDILKKLRDGGKTEIISFKAEKDFTDTEAAVNEAIERGYSDIVILGGTGVRYDHFMANLGVLKNGLKKGARIKLSDRYNRMFMIDRPEVIGKEDGYISFSAAGEPVEGFSLTGVRYPLKGHTLLFGDPMCVSNEFTGDARVSFDKGTVLVIISRDKDQRL